MANTKSAIKRIRRITRQTIVNRARKSKFKNAIKKMNLLIESKKKQEALLMRDLGWERAGFCNALETERNKQNGKRFE